jgi:hypothetical protein
MCDNRTIIFEIGVASTTKADLKRLYQSYDSAHLKEFTYVIKRVFLV